MTLAVLIVIGIKKNVKKSNYDQPPSTLDNVPRWPNIMSLMLTLLLIFLYPSQDT